MIQENRLKELDQQKIKQIEIIKDEFKNKFKQSD